MAVAAAGGGLLIAAASAVPAWASVPAAAPPAGHTVTISAHPRAQAGGGIGPHTILPCVARPGAGIRPASCGDQTIECTITADTPYLDTANNWVAAIASVDCSSEVDGINLTQRLLRSGVSVGSSGDSPQGKRHASSLVPVTCQSGTYTNSAQALITFPEGYVLTGGSNPIHQTSASFTVPPFSCNPVVSGGGDDGGGGGGGGGGVGCAIAPPSLSAPPAGRHPDFISCP